MSILAKLFGRGVPDWANFFNPSEFQSFVRAIRQDLQRRGVPFVIDAREGFARVGAGAEEPQQCGLFNVAQVCRQEPPEQWPEILARHFDIILNAGPDETLDELKEDYERARELVKVRIYPEDLLESLGRDTVVFRRVADGLIAVLVYDFPDRVVNVLSDHVQEWGRPLDELFEIALANVRAEGAPETTIQEIEPGVPIHLLGGDSHFSATHALFLQEYLHPPSPYGALVAIPHRHAVIYHPITDIGVLKAINVLLPIAHGMYGEGPGSITPQIYWWRTGKFTLLPSKTNRKRIEFHPPDEFLKQVLDPLSEASARSNGQSE